MEDSDVVIIGAGVAGLFAAYELLSGDFKGSITIVEQGQSMGNRLSQKHAKNDMLQGIGGPGFYTDGKVCFSEEAGTRLTDFIDRSILRDYIAYIRKVLKKFLPEEDLISLYVDNDSLQPVKSRLQSVNLALDLSYPVLHLGTDRVRQLAIDFEAFLRQSNVHFQLEAEVQEIKQFSDAIEIKFKKGTDYKFIRCQYLIAAVGKIGHDWFRNQFEQNNIIQHPNLPDIGIRLKFPNSVIQELMSVVKNPRIVMKWNDSYIKTHCWCFGGHISTYNYLGYSIVDGEVFKNSLTEYTGVNLLYHYQGSSDQDPVKEVRAMLHNIFQSNQGHAVIQNLGILKGNSQKRLTFKAPSSSRAFREAHLEGLLPKIVIEGFLEFIERLDAVWPGIADNSNLIYAPVVEWDTYYLRVDENMCTPISNIYAVGDGAGISQGIVSAATSGIIAAKHLSQTSSKPKSSKQFAWSIM